MGGRVHAEHARTPPGARFVLELPAAHSRVMPVERSHAPRAARVRRRARSVRRHSTAGRRAPSTAAATAVTSSATTITPTHDPGRPPPSSTPASGGPTNPPSGQLAAPSEL